MAWFYLEGSLFGNISDADILSAKLIKGWAKSKCKDFLMSHLESYKAALLISSDKADNLLDSIVNLWFAKFHWSIPVTQPHLYKPFLIPVSPNGFEILTDEQTRLKKDVIKRMQTVSDHILYPCVVSPIAIDTIPLV